MGQVETTGGTGPPPRKRRGERGQAMTEYAVAAAIVIAVLVGVTAIFLVHVGDFYENVVKVVSLPFP